MTILKSAGVPTITLVFAVLGLSIFLFFYVDRDKVLSENHLLKEELSGFGIFMTDEAATTNFVWDLRLKRFEAVTLYDPILALPGTDIEELSLSAATLKQSQELYLTYYTKEEQETIKELLHPFDFINSLPALEAARRAFLNEPNYFHAISYCLKLRSSLLLLRNYAQRLSDFILTLQGNDIRVAAPAGITSHKFVAAEVASAYESSDEKLKEANRRLFCLLGLRLNEDCEVSLPLVIQPAATSTDFDLANTERYGREMREYVFKNKPERYSLTDTPHFELPLVHISDSACTNRRYATYIFTWRPSRHSGLMSLWATPVEELLFHNVQKRVTEFDSTLADAGVTYEYQPLNYYMCVDSSLDVSRVRSAYYFQNWLKTSPILGSLKSEDLPDELKQPQALEVKIINQDDTLYVDDIERYVSLAQGFLSGTSSQKLKIKSRLSMLEAITLWRSQSGWLESEFNKADDLAMTTLYASRHINIPLDALFLSRGYYSVFLLAGNLTLYDESLHFIEERTPTLIGSEGLIDYETSLKHILPLGHLSDFMDSQGKLSVEVYEGKK